MAFTLRIQQKVLFRKKEIDIKQIIGQLKFQFGSDNDFYILEDRKINQNTCIIYNPKRIGRGIYCDIQKVKEGEVTIRYNIPSTPSEINDFLLLVNEIQNQFGKVKMYCEEEAREYTYQQLVEAKERMVQFSIESLNSFCSKDYENYILTLALWPIYLPNDEVSTFKTTTDLLHFEQLLHEKQNIDVYYAKPSLMKNKSDGKIIAFYTLTEECESIFPGKADAFINIDLNGIKIDKGLIRFYIFSEKRVRDEFCPYDKFIEYIKKQGEMEYDKEHFIVPSMSKEQIEDMIKSIGSCND